MTAREVIEEAQLLVGDPNIDFHDQERMLFALNRATNRISTRSRSIHESWFHPVAADQFQYALPPGTLYIRKAKYLRGTWRDLDRGTFNDVEARAAYPGGGTPSSFSLWQNARVEKTVSEVTGVDYDENREERLRRRVSFDVPHDLSGVLVGDLVFNLSDLHGEGVVTAIVSSGGSDTTTVAYTALLGGESDRFSDEDEIRITSPHTSGYALIIAPSPKTTDETGKESIAAFVARRHRTITMTEIDNENDNLELDFEFNDTLMYEILHWARVQRVGLDTTAQLYRRLSNEEYLTAIPKVENRIFEALSQWERNPGRGGTVYRDVDVKDTTGDGFNSVTVA